MVLDLVIIGLMPDDSKSIVKLAENCIEVLGLAELRRFSQHIMQPA